MKKWGLLLLSCSLLAVRAAWCDAPATSSATPEAMDMISISTDIAPSTMTVTMSSMTTTIHALHVTAWMAGDAKYYKYKDKKDGLTKMHIPYRAKLDQIFKETVVNAVVIDVKEYEGEVYIPGVPMAEQAGAYVPAMPDIAEWVQELKKHGIYTVARIVVFKDNIMPKKNPKMAVHNPQGDLWYDSHHITWLDPYNPEAWRYTLQIALQASKLGFDEVQFDYIRFPTDGKLSQMHFAKPYSKEAASRALVTFLHQASRLLHPRGTRVSIDVFGLTTSVNTGMGIGQVIGPMSDQVDFVCPMTYPSHYAKGEYGIPNPNDEPYRTIHLAMHDALKALGPGGSAKLRPYFQDFSLKGRGIRYTAKEVRAQIQAAADLGIGSWSLWNARCVYTLSALRTPFLVASVSVSTTSKTTDLEPSQLHSSTQTHTSSVDGKTTQNRH